MRHWALCPGGSYNPVGDTPHAFNCRLRQNAMGTGDKSHAMKRQGEARAVCLLCEDARTLNIAACSRWGLARSDDLVRNHEGWRGCVQSSYLA